jgi:hypothetical protein
MRVSRSLCRSCGARILWTHTESGKAMPVDVGARPNGNLALRLEAGAPIARVLRDGEEPGVGEVGRFVSHFASCPNSAQHRKR